MAHFTVIGLGRFGIATSLELIHLGHTITGGECDPKLAEKYVDELTQTVICDSTDENALRELDLDNSKAVLVAIGEDMQSSLLCTLALKNLVIKQIWDKASTKAHHTSVSKSGVDRIIHSEEVIGGRVAQALNYPMVNNYLSLGGGLDVVEIHIRNKLHNSPISDILNGSIKPVLVKRGTQVFSSVNFDFRSYENDVFLLCGTRVELKSIATRLM